MAFLLGTASWIAKRGCVVEECLPSRVCNHLQKHLAWECTFPNMDFEIVHGCLARLGEVSLPPTMGAGGLDSERGRERHTAPYGSACEGRFGYIMPWISRRVCHIFTDELQQVNFQDHSSQCICSRLPWIAQYEDCHYPHALDAELPWSMRPYFAAWPL